MKKKLNVAILPSSPVFLKDEIFKESKHRDDCLFFFRLFREEGEKKGLTVHTYDKFSSDEIDILIFYRLDLNVDKILNLVSCNKSIKLIHVMHEPSTVVPLHIFEVVDSFPFDAQYILNDDIANKSKRVNKICYGITPVNAEIIPKVNFKVKRFMATVAGAKDSGNKNELYSERVKAIKFFAEKPTGFDLYGVGWDKCTDKSLINVYRGLVDNKTSILQKYKFTLCFENTKGVNGYITEKIFDCFAAGTVPIYYGAPNIGEYIPVECFIDYREFSDYEDMYAYLLKMTECEYQEYLSAAKKFVRSDRYKDITAYGYVKTLLSAVSEISSYEARKTPLHLRVSLLINVLHNGVFFIKNIKKMKGYIFRLISL